jgi:hypothetical protein
VWPTALEVPVRDGETSDAYVRRLCLTEHAITCKDVVPEYWSYVLSAKVWRLMKDRARIAYGSCRWCAEDRSFAKVLAAYEEQHVKVEIAATDAAEKGRPRNWPVAGKNALSLGGEAIVSFRSDGWVTLDGHVVDRGAWREAMAEVARTGRPLALHFEPKRLVHDLLEVLVDAERAGYDQVGLVVREQNFPYDRRQYRLDTRRKNYDSFGIRSSDTVQILVQSLDHAVTRGDRDRAL